MIVVCDTSPLTNLAAIGQFDLLRRLFTEIHIAREVHAELNTGGRAHPGSREVAAADWVRQHEVADDSLLTVLRRDLDVGESATLVLALQLGASLVLLDEREARRVAEDLELGVMGVLGILLMAKSRGLVEGIRPLLDSLRHDAGFYLSDGLFRKAVDLAEE